MPWTATYKKLYKSSYTIFARGDRDPETGKYPRRAKSVKGNERKAKAEMIKWVNELNNGLCVEPSKMTVGQYLEKWLDDYGRANLAPTTYKNYGVIIKAHLLPALGHILLPQLQPMHLQSYYTKALKEGRKKGGGLSARSVRYHHAIIREALAHAVKWQLLSRNPADAVEPPKPAKPQLKVLQPEEAANLMQALREHELFPLFYTAMTTGMRRSELLGLRWEDVNLEAGVINLQRSIHRVAGQGYVVQPTKNKRGRLISMPPSLAALFKSIDRPHELVFARPGGEPLSPDEVSRAFTKAVNLAGFPGIRLHDLRHSHATILLAQGVHPKVVQERLGHAQIGMTLDTYSHVVPGLQEAAAGKIDDALYKR